MLFTTLMCGIPLLLVGIAATAVSLFDPPEDHFERLSAAAVAIMCVVFGVGFITMALPERWGAGAKMWRWCGWLVPLAILPFAAILLRDPATAADHTSRIGSSAAAIAIALAMVVVAALLARAWWRSVR